MIIGGFIARANGRGLVVPAFLFSPLSACERRRLVLVTWHFYVEVVKSYFKIRLLL